MDPEIISREEWGIAPHPSWENFSYPTTGLSVHHSVTPSTLSGVHSAQLVDRIHKPKGGFAYNYGIHRSGEIYEGRGRFKGAHTWGKNGLIIAFCFFGDFEPRLKDPKDPRSPVIGSDTLTPQAIESFQWLRWQCIQEGMLTPENLVRGHCDWAMFGHGTQCPGQSVMKEMDKLKIPYVPPLQEDISMMLIGRNDGPNPETGKPQGPIAVYGELGKRQIMEAEWWGVWDGKEPKWVTASTWNSIPFSNE